MCGTLRQVMHTCPVSIDPFLTLGGLFAGMVVGLTGLGGAAIVTPMLLLIFHVPPAVAVSTDVVSAAVMKPVGAAVHIKRRTPYYPVVLWLSMGSVPGVLLGTWLFSLLVEGEGGDTTLRRIIGVVLLMAVVVTLLRLRLRRYTEGSDELVFSRGKLAIASGVGLFVGTLVGLTSVGSGTLIAASLMMLFPAMLPSRLVGTDLVQAVPMLVVGAIAHAGLGEIDPTVLVSLLLGQIPGVFIGARISSRYNGQELRWLLLVLVGSAGLALLGVPSWIATTIHGRRGAAARRADHPAPPQAAEGVCPLVFGPPRGIDPFGHLVESRVRGHDAGDACHVGGGGVHGVPTPQAPGFHQFQRYGQNPLIEGVQDARPGRQPALLDSDPWVDHSHAVQREFLNHLDAGVQFQPLVTRCPEELAARLLIPVLPTEGVRENRGVHQDGVAHR